MCPSCTKCATHPLVYEKTITDALYFSCYQYSLHFYLCMVHDRDINEVIQRANATRYGLAAGLFTSSLDTMNTVTRALKVGMVWVNCYDVFDVTIPFGGFKESGHGREKGIYSLTNYLKVKAVKTAAAPLKYPAPL